MAVRRISEPSPRLFERWSRFWPPATRPRRIDRPGCPRRRPDNRATTTTAGDVTDARRPHAEAPDQEPRRGQVPEDHARGWRRYGERIPQSTRAPVGPARCRLGWSGTGGIRRYCRARRRSDTRTHEHPMPGRSDVGRPDLRERPRSGRTHQRHCACDPRLAGSLVRQDAPTDGVA